MSWPSSIDISNVSCDVKSCLEVGMTRALKGGINEPCRSIGAYSSNTMYLLSGRQIGLSAEDCGVHEKLGLKVSVSDGCFYSIIACFDRTFWLVSLRYPVTSDADSFCRTDLLAGGLGYLWGNCTSLFGPICCSPFGDVYSLLLQEAVVTCSTCGPEHRQQVEE